MAKIDFIGNGSTTEDIQIAFTRLCEDLERFGAMGAPSWCLGLKGTGATLLAKAEQIVNDAKNILAATKGYVNDKKY